MKKIIYLLIIIGLSSCNSKQKEEVIVKPRRQKNDVTYTKTIKPIINNKCIVCHGVKPLNGASVSLTDYESVKTLSGLIVGRISKPKGESGAMPFGGPRLSDYKINQFRAWIDGGHLE